MKKQEPSELQFKLLHIVSIIWKFKRKDTTASCLLPSQTPSERREDYYATSRREHLQTERWPVGGSLYSPAGKAEYGYVYAKSYAACREKRRRMEDALPQKPMLTGEMSVCQAAEFFLSERRGALKASTIGRYEYMIRHYIVPEIGTILLRDLTAEKLSVFFSRLQDRGLSCKSTRDVGVLLKTIFKVVKKKCHCDCPGRDVELPAYRSKKVEVFADHEIAALAQKVLDAPDITGLCVLLILNTGLRLGEICALKAAVLYVLWQFPMICWSC